ncbi:MAG: GAF domain-containing protein, partial [Desulfobacteraceae bacterium]
PEYYTTLGYKPKEGLGDRKQWLERVHPDDRAHVEAKIQEVLTGAPTLEHSRKYAYEARIRHADGTYRWQQVKGFGIKRDPKGRVTRMLGIRMDMTERRQAEQEIEWNLAINQALSSLYIPLVATDTGIEQIADAVLEKSRQLTESAHGYVAEIDPATGDLIAHTNTQMLQRQCRIAKEELRKIRFPRGADGLYNGLWGHALNTKEPFYTDGPVKHPASVGVPEGHIAIERFLTVPVLLAGELVGQVALSNPPRAYTDRDLDAINRIAEFYALAIQHKRVEDKIRQIHPAPGQGPDRDRVAARSLL